MLQTQLSNSACQAQAILGAWKSGDIQLFSEHLNRVGTCPMEPSESEEMERMELLRAIAADLRVPSIQLPVDDPANVYGNLLRHLSLSRPSRPHNSLRPGVVGSTAGRSSMASARLR